MNHDLQTSVSTSFFDLKRNNVELVPSGSVKSVSRSLAELEAMRVSRAGISASRHGLEAICGASCETGAQ